MFTQCGSVNIMINPNKRDLEAKVPSLLRLLMCVTEGTEKQTINGLLGVNTCDMRPCQLSFIGHVHPFRRGNVTSVT